MKSKVQTLKTLNMISYGYAQDVIDMMCHEMKQDFVDYLQAM